MIYQYFEHSNIRQANFYTHLKFGTADKVKCPNLGLLDYDMGYAIISEEMEGITKSKRSINSYNKWPKQIWI